MVTQPSFIFRVNKHFNPVQTTKLVLSIDLFSIFVNEYTNLKSLIKFPGQLKVR